MSTITISRLDRHDVLLAEGAPSESFVDDDSRGVFHNAAEWEALYPGRARKPAIDCAPRCETGYAIEASGVGSDRSRHRSCRRLEQDLTSPFGNGLDSDLTVSPATLKHLRPAGG